MKTIEVSKIGKKLKCEFDILIFELSEFWSKWTHGEVVTKLFIFYHASKSVGSLNLKLKIKYRT